MGLKDFFLFIYNDFKTDVLFLKKAFFGKKEEKARIAERVKVNVRGMVKAAPEGLKENWIWFLIVILALFTGFFLASQYYSMKCNLILDDINEELKEEYGIYVGGYSEGGNDSVEVGKVPEWQRLVFNASPTIEVSD